MPRIGKTDRQWLEQLFTRKKGAENTNVLQGPQFGVDTAIIRVSNEVGIAVATDPTSLIPILEVRDSAWLSVVLTANDIATTGSLPQYAQFNLNLPNTISEEHLQAYWEAIHEFCENMGIAITGGHTGFDAVSNTTISGGVTMFSTLQLSQAKTAAAARPHQDILMTKSAAFSAAAVLAKSFPRYVQKHLGREVFQQLEAEFYSMSILPEVKILNDDKTLLSQVTAMHDVTEGGVLGAAYELAAASEVGLNINKENILLGEPQRKICELFNINPYRSLGAGSLLLVCQREATPKLLQAFAQKGINAAKIGETLPKEDGRWVKEMSAKIPLHYEEEDPYWEAFSRAFSENINELA